MIESSTIIGLVVVARFLDDINYFYAGNGSWISIDKSRQTNMHYMNEKDANDTVKKYESRSNILSISVSMHVSMRRAGRTVHDVLVDPVGVMNYIMPSERV